MAWRDTRDPYRILVSEVMLQQTQVERVREKYDAFIRRFPTLSALARAPLGDVLRLWSGLGYNRRARYLHECAKMVLREHEGRFPETYDGLVRLPGIGRSTAGALLAFAFGMDTPMIDTNVRRILARVFFPKKLPGDAELYAFAAALIPKGKGRAWNYAMLDIGATRCTARGHHEDCPLTNLHAAVVDAPKRRRSEKPFIQTDRYHRGRVMKLLLLGAKTRTVIGNEIGLPVRKLSPILSGLVRDGLVEQHVGRYRLPK